MNRIKRWGMIAALLLMSSPAYAQDAAKADAAGGEASDKPTATNRQRIARVNGMSTSYNSGNSNSLTSSSGASVRTHDVVDGDTLWAISETYLSDPFMWPALWSYNPQITNPHWIYPGDTVYLEPYKAELTENLPAPEEKPLVTIGVQISRSPISVPGIYLSEIPKNVGHILFSDQEKHMITYNDNVQVDWVDIEVRKKVSVGQRFVIFSEDKAVRDEDGEPLANKLIRVGVLEIIDVQKDSLATGRIVKAFREIERGDIILPDMDLVFEATRTPNTKNLQGVIIDTIDKTSQIGEQLFVIVNRGSEDGVQPGNSFAIFEQREGLNRLPEYESDDDDDDKNKDRRDGELERDMDHSWVLGHEPRAPEYPPRKDVSELYEDRDYTLDDLPVKKIGEVIIVNTQDKYSTGMIVDNSREIAVGTPIVMIRGN